MRPTSSSAHQVEEIEHETSEAGGDPACWAHLVCPGCGAVTNEGHRPGCDFAPEPLKHYHI